MDRVDRRCFLKWSLLVGSSLSALLGDVAPLAVQSGARVLRAGCPSHNCGGRCLLKLHIEKGIIVRIETDDRPSDSVDAPQLRACIRGRAYRRRQDHPDRLLRPLKRVGRRGEGKFQPISWNEALDKVASELLRVRKTYGNSAIFVPCGTGSYSQTNGRQVAQRLMNLFGGSLGHYNNYSWACMARATETVYGTTVTGNQRQDWLNSKYILMWGWNPSEMRDGTNTEYFLRKARENGARIVCVDPRMTLSAVALADEWVPIRPDTDVAMMSAMTQLAFFVNSDACSGCKTCQVACKDRNNLPAGLHWRRVYEVTAGAWQKKGDAWTSTVAAYNLSVACHHCLEPVCGKQCSVDAIWKRPDGIVLIDQARCITCNKCRADCPYEAIRYDAATNTVSKCDFCLDAIEAGQAPACVAACPNRALDFGDYDDVKRRYGTLDRVFPLEDPAISRPALVIKPHRHAALVQGRQPEMANWEEL